MSNSRSSNLFVYDTLIVRFTFGKEVYTASGKVNLCLV